MHVAPTIVPLAVAGAGRNDVIRVIASTHFTKAWLEWSVEAYDATIV